MGEAVPCIGRIDIGGRAALVAQRAGWPMPGLAAWHRMALGVLGLALRGRMAVGVSLGPVWRADGLGRAVPDLIA